MIRPILLISETFFWQGDVSGMYREVIERIAPHRFYSGVETKPVDNASERKELRGLCEAHELTLLQWLTKPLLDRNLSLCSLNGAKRSAAVSCAKECIDKAAECGAFGVGLVSGADPGPAKRTEAYKALEESFSALLDHLEQYGMQLIVEALDREAHKKQLLGPTTEAVWLIERLRAVSPRCGLCWDSAHVALLGEDLRQAMLAADGYCLQMHLSNAVLDAESGLFGDHHFPPGDIGFLTADRATELLRFAREIGLVEGGLGRVGIEARTLPGNDPWITERIGRLLLGEAMRRLN